jgi:hypothetical protein
VALLSILCAASPSAAQDAIDLYGTSEAMLGWDPAPGPVSGYYVVVQRNGQEPAVDGVVTDTRATIQADFGDAIVVTVNAFDEAGVPGPTSDPSPTIRFHASSDGGSGPPDGGDPPPDDGGDPPPDGGDPPIEPPVTQSAAADDFTGNGTSDLFLRSGDEFTIFSLDTADAPVELTVPTPAPSWYHAGTGDLDGNGTMDLVVASDAMETAVALLFTDGVITDGGVMNLDVGTEYWPIVGMGDLDGDGRDDLVRRDTDSNRAELVFMRGMEPNSRLELEADPSETAIAAIDDLDGDGIDEIVWLDAARQKLSLWDLHGEAADAVLLAELGAGWRVIGAGDFDGDGAADLFAHHAGAGQLEVWRLQAGAVSETIALPNAAGFDPVSIGDFDGDGRADLALHEAETQRMVAWYSDGAQVSQGILLEATDWTAPPNDIDRICAADFDGDGVILNPDLAAAWECRGEPGTGVCSFADLDGNGKVTNRDLKVLKKHLGTRACEGAQ